MTIEPMALDDLLETRARWSPMHGRGLTTRPALSCLAPHGQPDFDVIGLYQSGSIARRCVEGA